MSERDNFRALLIGATISKANELDGFRKLYNGFDISEIRIDNLSKLPILTKELILATPEAFIDHSLDTSISQHTKGTTGVNFEVLRSDKELEFIDSFFRKVQTQADENVKLPTCIALSSMTHHGTPTKVPYKGNVVSINIFDYNFNHRDLYLLVKNIVSACEDFFITGLESEFRVLSHVLIENGYDFASKKPQKIILTGDLITDRLKTWYKSIWHVSPINRYSLSESFGGATLCSVCGHFHFDPYLLGEIVSLSTNECLTEGIGGLVITCLYPFVQKQPLVRYWTGDLVQAYTGTCMMDQFGFDYLGRIKNSIIMDKQGSKIVVLPSGTLYNILDNYPEICSSKMYLNVKGFIDYSAFGHLIFEVSRETSNNIPQIQLKIALRFCHHTFPTHADDLATRIKSDILEQCEELRNLIQADQLILQISFDYSRTGKSFMPDEIE